MARKYAKSKRTYKRKYTQKSRFMKTTYGKGTVLNPMKGLYGSYYFKRTTNSGILTNVANNNIFYAYSFSLSSLPNYTEFQNLFHNYRILKIVFKVVPTFTGNEMVNTYNGGPNWQMSNISTFIDYNDATLPTDENTFLQAESLKITRAHRIHTRVFKPAVLAAAYEGITSTAYIPKFGQWITTNGGDSSTPHYGIKMMINNNGSVAMVNFRIYTTYYFQCKDLR